MARGNNKVRHSCTITFSKPIITFPNFCKKNCDDLVKTATLKTFKSSSRERAALPEVIWEIFKENKVGQKQRKWIVGYVSAINNRYNR